MPDQPFPPAGYYNDDTIATWLPSSDVSYQLPRRMAAPLRTNPTFYYATAFYTQDGYSILQGVTVNTLQAGP